MKPYKPQKRVFVNQETLTKFRKSQFNEWGGIQVFESDFVPTGEVFLAHKPEPYKVRELDLPKLDPLDSFRFSMRLFPYFIDYKRVPPKIPPVSITGLHKVWLQRIKLRWGYFRNITWPLVLKYAKELCDDIYRSC